MPKKITLVISILLLFQGVLFSQTDSIQYTPDFIFKPGIYKTYAEFRMNKPSIVQNAIIIENKAVQLALGDGFKAETIAFYDSTGNPQKIKSKDIWGYSSNGAVYIQFHRIFHRIFRLGAIILFTEAPNSIDNSGILLSTITIVGGAPFYGKTKSSNPNSYMIDYRSGLVYYYNLPSFQVILESDKELYDEFNSIKKDKEKKEKLFVYLRKFNERHPIYFPAK